MSYYGKIAVAKLNEREEKENKMDVESIVKGLRKKELEKAGFDKKTIDYLSKQKHHTEDEKENASVQDKFSHKGCLITILKKGEGKYTFTITKDGREEGTNNVYSTQDEAERKAKREVEEEWANSKEEKNYYAKIVEQKNASESDIRAMYAKIQELKKKGVKGENIDKFLAAVNYRQAAEQHRKKFKETGEVAYKWAAEKADKQADQWIAEVNRSINK